MVQVVRCFEDESVIHVEGSVDPARDIETIQIELALADLATAERRREKALKNVKGGDKIARAELAVLEKLLPVLEQGKSARTVFLTEDEHAVARDFFLLTMKPTIYAANVDEQTLSNSQANPGVKAVQQIAAQEAAECLVICAHLEAELVSLSPEERAEYLKSLGVSGSGVDRLIKSAYHVLGLMSFLTAGEKEVRAWTIAQGTRAQEAAGTIHSDIERGFIRAEVISYEDSSSCWIECSCTRTRADAARGKDYALQEGDVVHFRSTIGSSRVV